jgi:hypothetical protein
MPQMHILTFEGGGATEFARSMKALRDETGFQARLVQVTGRFPQGQPDIIKLFVEVDDFLITKEEFHQKVVSYVPIKKDGKKDKQQKEQSDV